MLTVAQKADLHVKHDRTVTADALVHWKFFIQILTQSFSIYLAKSNQNTAWSDMAVVFSVLCTLFKACTNQVK